MFNIFEKLIIIRITILFDYAAMLIEQILNKYPSYISVPAIILSVLIAERLIIFVLSFIVKKLEKGVKEYE